MFEGLSACISTPPLPVLAKGKTHTGRLWTMMRDDRPFGGPEPPAAAYFYSPDRPDAHAVTCDPADRGGPPQLDYRRLGSRRSSRDRLSTLIKTAKLNGIDAQVCLADVLGRLPDYPALRINDLLPWNWTQHQPRPIAA